MKAQMGAEV